MPNAALNTSDLALLWYFGGALVMWIAVLAP
jgi:hypothetical protein